MFKEINYYLKGFNDGMLRASEIAVAIETKYAKKTYNGKLTKKERSEVMKKAWIRRRLREIEQNKENNNAENNIY